MQVAARLRQRLHTRVLTQGAGGVGAPTEQLNRLKGTWERAAQTHKLSSHMLMSLHQRCRKATGWLDQALKAMHE